MSTPRFLALGAALLLAALGLALWVRNEYVFYAGYAVLQFVALASAWNILGGYAGYVNFGSAAFFATGAYAAVALGLATGAPLPLQLLAGAAASAALGLGVGALSLRLRGVFFSIATVAVTVVCETVVLNWDAVGGARGTALLQPAAPPWLGSYNRLLFLVMALIAAGTVALARWVERSPLGRGLQALRDDELAAEAAGVPTLRLKLFAATLSGALMGLAGAPFSRYMSFIEPGSAFSLNYGVNALAMPIIGGTASWPGPVIGAVLLAGLQQAVSVTVSSELNVLLVGVLLVAFVVAAPDGLLGLAHRLRRRRCRR